MRIYILTSEPNNFVPDALKKHAEALEHEAHIIDMARTALYERSTKGEDKARVMFFPEPPKDEEKPATAEGEQEKSPKPMELTAPCVVITRLNEYNIEYKLGVFQRLKDHGAVLLNSPESMALCNDKLASQIALNTSGLRTPYSVVLGDVELIDDTLKGIEDDDKLKFPMIMKTLRGTHGIGVMRVDSRSSLVSVAQAVMAEGHEVMLQEFIPHEQSCRLIMLGDEMLAANKRGQPKDKDEFRTNSHLGSKTEKYEPSENELAIGRKIVELFGCRFCAIDYIIDDGQVIVLEVNGSPGLEAIQKDWEGERDLAKMVIEYCAKLHVDTDVGSQEAPAVEPHVEPRQDTSDDHPLSDMEPIRILRLSDEPIEARVDTGAGLCSLHADDVREENGWVKFRRGDITYKVPLDRHIKIKNANDTTRRHIVCLDVEVRGKRFNKVEFTITDRGDLKYEALIGRNLLELLGLPVMVYNTDGTQAHAKEMPQDGMESASASEEE